MPFLRAVWRLANAASTIVWILSVTAGLAVTVAAGLLGALEGLPRLLQVFAALAVFGFASLLMMEVIQYGRLHAGRFRRPQLEVSSGTGFEFLHTTRPLEGYEGERVFDELIQWEFPDDRFTAFHTLKLKVAEVGNARAKNVLLRIAQVDPPPEPGQYSLPIPLPQLSGEDTTMEPGEVRYVALLHFAETAEGRRGLTPAVPWGLHDELTFEVEALIDGNRSFSRWFKVRGHVTRDADNRPTVLGIPKIEEVQSP